MWYKRIKLIKGIVLKQILITTKINAPWNFNCQSWYGTMQENVAVP